MVSSRGKVKSIDRLVNHPRGGKRMLRGKLKSTMVGKRGYVVVDITFNGKRKNHKVHRLVAAAFHENLENKPQVNHIDGNRLNNNFENLEWCTSSENLRHSHETILTTKGVRKCSPNRWSAFISIHGLGKKKQIYLGIFKTEQDAKSTHYATFVEWYGYPPN